MSAEALAAETGLEPGHIELGVLWNNLEAQRWHERFGGAGRGSGGDGG